MAQATRKKHAKSLVEDSPFVRLQREVQQQDPTYRQALIAKLEKLLGARVVTFFTSFRDPSAAIEDDDAEMLESLLSTEHDGTALVLVVNSPGGSALAAERIVNVCRTYCRSFEVLVPHMAKSAATMIAFGATAIRMSKTAELGPVDPQVKFVDDQKTVRWISAEEYVRSYDNLMKKAADGKNARIEPYLQQLARYDSRYIEQLRSYQQLSRDISVRLLQSTMPRLKPATILKKMALFLSQSRTAVHSRMINPAEAALCGLTIKDIPVQSELWNTVWELHVRSDYCVTQIASKLMESRTSSVTS